MQRIRKYALYIIPFLLLLAAAPQVASAQTEDPAEVNWFARYWNNTEFAGEEAVSRTEVDLTHNWGFDSPTPGVEADGFSARWVATVEFDAGAYRFTTTSDDGIRVSVDGETIIDNWTVHAPTENSAEINLVDGVHNISVDYFENDGRAVASLDWERIGDAGDVCEDTYVVQPGDWLARIARRCGVSLEALQAANPQLANPNIIHVGTELNIPNGEADQQPQVSISPQQGVPGTEIAVNASGFPANTEVMVGIGRAESETATSTTVTTDANGNLETTITVPEFADPGDPWRVLVWVDGIDALSGDFMVTGAEFTATTQENLNLRSLPNEQSEILDVIPAGTTVPVLGRTPAVGWLLVTYEGRRGWISGWLTDIGDDLPDVPVETP
jgi:hypothetical protein